MKSTKAGGRRVPPIEALLTYTGTVRRSAAVDDWMARHPGPLGDIARRWFGLMRECGDDVRELLHDGYPTACIGEAAFAYVGAFTAHVNVGFYRGTELPDPAGLLEGTGKRMRHVKLRPGDSTKDAAVEALIRAAHADMRARLAAR